MSSALAVIAPVFALVLVGWIARRSGVLGEGATTELNRFVVWLALPTLLFDLVAHARWTEIWRPGFIGAFGGAVAAVFVLTILVRRRGRPLADTAIYALGAAYGNTAFVGFPILSAALGSPGLLAAMIATLITVCILFGVAVALIETGLQSEARPHRVALKAARATLANPLVAAPLLGAAAALAGLAIPAPAETAIKMLGATASPCALITIGLFLGGRRPAGRSSKSETTSAVLLTALKLLLLPAIAWGLTLLLRLAPAEARAVLLLAAMPTGTGPFMLAEFYGREAGVASRAILISTVLSAVTLPVCLVLTR
jgi:predicted permease